MPAMVFRTGDYIRRRGLEQAWPDPKILETAGIQLERFRRGNRDEIAFRLSRHGDQKAVLTGWSFELRTGSVVNLHLEPGDTRHAEEPPPHAEWKDAILVSRRTWLHWVEVSDTIVLTFDKP